MFVARIESGLAGHWVLVACIFTAQGVQAQTAKWPEKTVRIVVAAPPGGGDDFVTRLIAPKLSDLLGQPFVVENRGGAGGLIGQSYVQKSIADGYTFLLAGGSMAGARFVNAQAAYDVLRDFAPVSLLEVSQFVLMVHPAVPAKTVKDYIALARRQPGKLTYATLGAGQIPYWSALLFNSMADIRAVEVAYKGFAEAVSDLMGGRVDYFFSPSSTAIGYKAKLHLLAVTGANRSPSLPDVPTLAEAALPGYEMPSWRSIVGPAGVRSEIVATLNGMIARSLAMPDVREKMITAGFEPTPSTPDELSRRFADWIERFGKIAKQSGVKPL